jgi:hypothetical protein
MQREARRREGGRKGGSEGGRTHWGEVTVVDPVALQECICLDVDLTGWAGIVEGTRTSPREGKGIGGRGKQKEEGCVRGTTCTCISAHDPAAGRHGCLPIAPFSGSISTLFPSCLTFAQAARLLPEGSGAVRLPDLLHPDQEDLTWEGGRKGGREGRREGPGEPRVRAWWV